MHPSTAPLLASAGQDGRVLVWDRRRPQDANLVLATAAPALCIDWHPRKDYVIAVGLEDGIVAAFDTRAPAKPLNTLVRLVLFQLQLQHPLELTGNDPTMEQHAHEGAAHVVKYSPFHEDLLASGGDDARVALTTSSCVSGAAQLAEASTSHSDYVRGLAWFNLRDPLASHRRRSSATLASGGWDRAVRAWRSDAHDGQSLLERAL